MMLSWLTSMVTLRQLCHLSSLCGFLCITATLEPTADLNTTGQELILSQGVTIGAGLILIDPDCPDINTPHLPDVIPTGILFPSTDSLIDTYPCLTTACHLEGNLSHGTNPPIDIYQYLDIDPAYVTIPDHAVSFEVIFSLGVLAALLQFADLIALPAILSTILLLSRH